MGSAHRIVAALLAWTLCGLGLWLGAGLLCPQGNCGVPATDSGLLAWLQGVQRPWLDGLMATVTWTGSILVLLPVALLLSWRHWQRGERANALLLAGALAGAWLLAHAAKIIVARPRPDLHAALTAMPADPSFPSAHTLQISAFVMAWLLRDGFRPRWPVMAVAALAVGLVSLSRMYLQVHFPSDVAAGLVMGAAWATGLHLALRGTTDGGKA